MNYYELLEVSSGASIEIIKIAYKTLAKKYHPDTYEGDPSFAEQKMRLLNEAISVLSDDAKRREYDSLIVVDLGDPFKGKSTFTPDAPEPEKKPARGSPVKEEDYISKIDEFIDDTNAADDDGAFSVASEDLDEITKDLDAAYASGEIDLAAASEEIDHDAIYAEEEEEDIIREELEDPEKGLKKKPKIGSWYYITVWLLILGIIILAALIISEASGFIEGIRNLFQGGFGEAIGDGLENGYTNGYANGAEYGHENGYEYGAENGAEYYQYGE